MKIRKLEWFEVDETTVAVIDGFGVFYIHTTGKDVPAFRWQHNIEGKYANAGYSDSLEAAKTDAQEYFEKKARQIVNGIEAIPFWHFWRKR